VIEDRKENVIKTTEKELSCSFDEVYDPYMGICQKIVSTESQTAGHGKDNETEESRGNSTGLHLNCTFITFNKTDYVKLSNGSVYLKLHRKLYSNMTYVMRDNKLLLCVNFSRNATGSGSEKEIDKRKITTENASIFPTSHLNWMYSVGGFSCSFTNYIYFVC